jgi:hypothetical protein
MSIAWRAAAGSHRAPGIVDPYYERAAATDFSYYGKDVKWFPVLIELHGLTVREFASGRWHPRRRQGAWSKLIRIPPAYIGRRANLNGIRFCSALVRREFFKHLTGSSRLNQVIRRFELGLPVKLHSPLGGGSGAAAMLMGVAPPGKVVTGIIDEGLAFAHSRFLRGSGTRIEYFWDQGEPNPNPLPNWDYGRELTKGDVGAVWGIDHWLNACTYAGLVDEDEVYRRTGFVDFGQPGHKATARRGSHGTHVMDLACGYEPAGAPADRPIVCVQLPARTTEDTSGATLGPQVIDALHYIVDRAARIAAANGGAALPIVVNLSYGTLAGPHDGTSLLEAAIADLAAAHQAERGVPLQVVLPAGNSYLSRCHARFSLAAGMARSLHWRVLPDDATESSLEIWLPYPIAGGAPPRVRVRVTSPAGDATPWIAEGGGYEWATPGDVLCKLRYYTPLETGTRGCIVVSLPPTASHDPELAVAPSGTWRIRVRNPGSAAIQDIDGWIQRDDTPYGYPVRGRQSRFDDPSYRRFDDGGREIEVDDPASYVKRAGTINAIATGTHAVVIAGSRRSSRKQAKYSAAGPIVNPAPGQPNGPDAMAVSEDSDACGGLLAAGTRSGSVVAMNGSSVAAPQIARWIAGEWAALPPRAGDRAAVALQAQTPPLGLPATSPPAIPTARAGAGRIRPRAIRPRPPVERFEP